LRQVTINILAFFFVALIGWRRGAPAVAIALADESAPVASNALEPEPPPALPHSVPDDFVLGSSAPNEARRAVEQRSFAARPVLLELRGGLGTIVGFGGATVSFDPWSRLAIGAGLGASTSGLQLAAFLRVRPLVFIRQRRARLHALGLEIGYSTGPFRDFLAPAGDGLRPAYDSYSWDRVHWIEPQLTYETRSYRGFNVLCGLGAEIPIATQGYHCTDPALCPARRIAVLPTVTVGIGWALR
jgi:hypothetical protein